MEIMATLAAVIHLFHSLKRTIMNSFDNPNFINPNTVSPRPTGIRWGLIWGGAGVVFALVMHLTGLTEASMGSTGLGCLTGLLSLGIAVYCLDRAITHHRDQELGGHISVSRGLMVTLWAGLVQGGINGVFQVLLLKVIDPGFMERMKTTMMATYAEKGMSEEQIDQAMGFASMFMNDNPVRLFATGLLGGLFMALIVGLVMSLIRKKEPKLF